MHLAGGEQVGALRSAPLGLTGSAGWAAHPQRGKLQAASLTSPAALKPQALESQYKEGPWKSPRRQETGHQGLLVAVLGPPCPVHPAVPCSWGDTFLFLGLIFVRALTCLPHQARVLCGKTSE